MAAPRRVDNPPNPFESAHVEFDEGSAPSARLEVYEEEAKSILSENRSPDLGFRFSLNPYRGCFHGCIYCYARPSHQYLGFGAGTDFDRKIVAKINAPELLERRLRRRGWEGEPIAFSGNTDCYQPIEASYELTRRCLDICLTHENPVGIVTKGTLVRRDLDLLARLAERELVWVCVSVAFSDDEPRRVFDPFAPPVDARFETMRRLTEAGVPVGVGLSPILPGVNDSMIPRILERAREAGARTAFMTLARLPAEVRPYFLTRLREGMPLRADKVVNGLHELRERQRRPSDFGARMRGEGPRWDAIRGLFDLHVRRLGMLPEDLPPTPKKRAAEQLSLALDASTEFAG